MKKWLNDLYAELLKYGFNPGTGPGPGPGPTPEPESYSNIYFGKYLGDTYTDEQKNAIANGSFDGLNIGDYWTINGINWRIADVDYYYNVGDTPFTKHHIIIVPDTTLYNDRMNRSNDTSNCYSGSSLAGNIDNSYSYFYNAFGESYIPRHKMLYSNAATDGVPKDWEWQNIKVALMSEEQVYGHAVWGTGSQNGYDVGTQKTQFRLFSLDPSKINIRSNYWLTNVKSSTEFAYVDANGNANYKNASNSDLGVRPFACVIGDLN
jgi:hypothetical protein